MLSTLVCVLAFAAWAQALYPTGSPYGGYYRQDNSLPNNLYRRHFNSHQSYNGHYNHHHRGSKVLRMMCSPDDCVPHEIKEDIKAHWTETGSSIWDKCVSDKGRCNYNTMNDIGLCVFHTMLNNTDITIRNAIETWEKWSFKGVEDCCSDSITLKMLTCTRHINNTATSSPYYQNRNHRYSQYGKPSYDSLRHRTPLTVMS